MRGLVRSGHLKGNQRGHHGKEHQETEMPARGTEGETGARQGVPGEEMSWKGN